MAYRLRSVAKDDLETIWDYTYQQWGVDQAELYFSQLFDCFEKLALNPSIGRKRDDLLPGIMSFPEGRHMVFYENDGEGIVIISIVHQSADVNRHLGSDH